MDPEVREGLAKSWKPLMAIGGIAILIGCVAILVPAVASVEHRDLHRLGPADRRRLPGRGGLHRALDRRRSSCACSGRS